MHSRTIFLLLASTLLACSGDDTSTTDGGNDATTSDVAQNKDVTTTDTGNDVTTTTDAGDSGTTTTDGGDGGTTTGDGGSFACGTTTCSSATQYCSKTKTGPDGGLPIDAGNFDAGNLEVDTCSTLPTACTADGGTPSCSCIQKGNCGCTDTSGDITVTCP